MSEYVEVRRLNKNLNMYHDWTIVSRFLACGLQGIEIREIKNKLKYVTKITNPRER